jgi:hypothetical protein
VPAAFHSDLEILLEVGLPYLAALVIDHEGAALIVKLAEV